ELPNTHGMAIFADGGVIASKPYAASANYINKMSDYCGNCRYNHKGRVEDDACPFNALYWNFLIGNQDVLQTNPRMGLVLKNVDRLSDDDRKQIQARAASLMKSFGMC
ncbi:MAG TPA: cryptochrome/photolyase family protein, partial [Hyphomonas atlantica]|nr:cryptochrome/photolyase family protein [Hyphomonas atlantica]HBQ47285.1 cryptochrome/photolyase family protein [Hyphomonas atlantica]